MAAVRRVALGLLLAASAAVLLLAALELWNYRQWAYLPSNDPRFRPKFSDDARARLLQDRMDFLSKRVGDMELLVLILLGTSGLYAIVFVASSYLSSASFTRLSGQTISHVQDQIGLAMGDLRELQEQTEQNLKGMLARPVPANYDRQLADMIVRLPEWQEEHPSEESKLGLLRDESAAAHLDAMAASDLGESLATLYLGFSRIYARPDPGRSDPTRSRFYLDQALRLAPPQSPLASEIRYELACRFAASHDFGRAMDELTAAFEHQFKALEERLAWDIDEGGQLYALASTPPFEKAINDLLLSMSIGIG